MNFSLYIFGTPNGYNQYPADNSSIFLQDSAKSNAFEQLTIFRNGMLVYYSYIRRLDENSGKYLGFCLVFNGVYCQATKKIFELFGKVFYDVQLKGELLRSEIGNNKYLIEKFVERPLEFERIRTIFKYELESKFNRNFIPIPTSFKFGNSSGNISIQEADIDILSAIAKYTRLHITNTEKVHTELERAQKMLVELFAEKQEINKKYLKLQSQKKQYKVVLILSFLIIGCIAGLVIYYKSLQSADSKIESLETELKVRNSTISTQNSTIQLLRSTQNIMKGDISRLNDSLNNTISILDNKLLEIDELNYELSTLNLENTSLRHNITELKNKNKILASINYVQKYKVIVPKAYCYRLCGEYRINDCYYSSGSIVEVYAQRDGYGLTIGGYLKMSELQKQ